MAWGSPKLKVATSSDPLLPIRSNRKVETDNNIKSEIRRRQTKMRLIKQKLVYRAVFVCGAVNNVINCFNDPSDSKEMNWPPNAS